ncbi:MAG TPA: cysteine desulfurase-like protein, partial [Gemmataceae bacterium]|nr:cysteine desulfurase-like protein [Gemmataceae bacterium]
RPPAQPGLPMLDPIQLRRQFPSLHRTVRAKTPIYLDGPGGTQVPQRVIDAMVRYLSTCNANHGGAFTTSRESDAVVRSAHQAVADFLNAPSPEEIVFGANMTTLTLHLSRAFGRTLNRGEAVLVTRLDHDANIRPWLRAADDAGAEARFVDIHPEDCTLDLDDLRRKLTREVRLLAATCASNLVGTINDVKAICRTAHDAGALVFLDAVHYAPHGPIDVQDWDCDFLACSAYKFFGPHVGVLWGRRSLLEKLPAYKLRPAPESLPDRWMTGTQNHEGLAGAAAAVEYLTEIGAGANLKTQLRSAMNSIREYESALVRRLLAGLANRPRFRVWGVTRPDQSVWRAPTVALTASDRTPQQMADHLAAREIYAWAGNMYALELSERLGQEASGGFLRLGLAHYNTADEVDRTLAALDEL